MDRKDAKWTVEFHFHKEILKMLPISVNLFGLPLYCWGTDSIHRIGSILGTPHFADECTTKLRRIAYARINVEIDVTRELVPTVTIMGVNGKFFQ